MKSIKKYFGIFFFTVTLLLNSCIGDNITPPLTGKLEPAAEMLVYFETQGDFANSPYAPALIDAEEVYNNLSTYLIIDLREPAEFVSGHIEGSVNLTSDSIYNYLENININSYPKIIIVSKNGQSSACFTCLLRLAGYDNVYSINFGLASWNQFFADEWLNAIGNDPEISDYTNNPSIKNEFTPLPEIVFKNPDAPIQERINERIKDIISSGFREGIQYRNQLSVSPNDYLVCYGNNLLYFAPQHGPGHNPAAVFYLGNPFFDFRAQKFLQTLPANKKILIYDENGQNGACISAYLRVLGYDAQTLLFGGNQLIYYARLIYTPELIPFAFDQTDIMNYPYITGE